MKITKLYTMSDPKGIPFASVCLATHNKATYLRETLSSIREANSECSFAYEVIVVDDKSTDDTFEVCKEFGVTYVRIPENTRKNPAFPRNAAFRLARGKAIIHQSDEVVHCTWNSIEKLVTLLEHNNFVIATVQNVVTETREIKELYTGFDRQKPYFFLGALTKKAVDLTGGYDEDFVSPGYDDDKFADDLMRFGYQPIWTDSVIGHHLDHPKGNMSCGADSSALYFGKKLHHCGGTNGLQDKIS